MNLEIPKDARVIVIEGVAGSGKDTFLQLLKEKFSGKLVYDYSEGELLFSWKHARIKGLAKMTIQFHKAFLGFVEQVLSEEPESIFLLNRFHLSAYMAYVSKDNTLKGTYDKIVEHLRKLPVHIFILKLSSDEIERRSAHMERPDTWKKYQQMMVKKEGFFNYTERYLNEQKMMLEAAEKQKIPFSVISGRWKV